MAMKKILKRMECLIGIHQWIIIESRSYNMLVKMIGKKMFSKKNYLSLLLKNDILINSEICEICKKKINNIKSTKGLIVQKFLSLK